MEQPPIDVCAKRRIKAEAEIERLQAVARHMEARGDRLVDEIKQLRATLGHESSYRINAVAEATRLRTELAAERERISLAGWEVEGFIDRLARRDEANSERLILEAISHLRAFSRECDALRETKVQAVAATRERCAWIAECFDDNQIAAAIRGDE